LHLNKTVLIKKCDCEFYITIWALNCQIEEIEING
jgi:hypothetical protein